MINQTISHYKILEKLGEGGMGIVYKAFDTKLERTVALKVLRPETIGDPVAKSRFIREAKAASKLNHSNITTIYEVDEWHGRNFISMEFVEGQTLREKIRSGPLSIDDELNIAEQVAEALQEAHRQNIVHRDIKSENIMVTPNGKAKIMDFGLAKLKGMDTVTKTGTTIGTVAYMSPEQARGENIDFRTDIWSLGVVLYEMITGQLPFKGDYDQAVIYSILNYEPKPMSELCPQIPISLHNIVNTALKKQLEQRYQSIKEFSIDLQIAREEIKPDVHVSTKKKKLIKSLKRRNRLQKGTLSAISVREFIKQRKTAIIAACLLCLLSLFVSLQIFLPKVTPELSKDRVAIAIFENQTGDPAFDNLGRIVADWTVQYLAATELVAVVPVINSETTNGDAYELASKTRAQLIVIGSYFKQNELLQFQAQICDAKKREVLKAIGPITGYKEDLSKIVGNVQQHTIAGVASIIDPRFEEFKNTPGPTPKYNALQEYNAGMDSFTKLEYDKAIKHFNIAIELESDFVLPMLTSAWIHYNLMEYARSDSLVRKIKSIKQPVGPLNQNLLDCLAARLKGDYFRALSASRKSAHISPSGGSYLQLGLDAIYCNRPREAINAFKNLDPQDNFKNFPWFWHFLTLSYHLLGDHKTELKVAHQGREQQSESLHMRYYELRALAALGKIEDVYALLYECLSLPPDPDWTTHGSLMRRIAEVLRVHGHKEAAQVILKQALDWYNSQAQKRNRLGFAQTLEQAGQLEQACALFDILRYEDLKNIYSLGFVGILAAKRGDKKEAKRISRLLEEMDNKYLFGGHTYIRAQIAAQLGEKKRAIDLLRESLRQGSHYYQIHGDVYFEPLWDYPPFQELIKPKG